MRGDNRLLLKDPLLVTKLQLPALSHRLVSRPHLTAQLNEVLKRKLTLVSAPAGYGKTTLICEWLATFIWIIVYATLIGFFGVLLRYNKRSWSISRLHPERVSTSRASRTRLGSDRNESFHGIRVGDLWKVVISRL